MIVPRTSLQNGRTSGFQAPSVQGPSPVRSRQIENLGNAAVQGGETLQSVGDFLQRAEDERANERATAEALEADNQAFEFIQTKLRDPKTGFLQARGRDAGDRRETTTEEIRKQIDSLGAGLSSDAARDVFTRSANSYWKNAVVAIDDHTAKENRTYLAGQLGARLTLRQEEWAATDEDQDEWREVIRGEVEADVAEMADMLGLSGDEKQSKRAEVLAGMHGARLEHLSSQPGEDAPETVRGYIDRWEDEIPVAIQDKYRQEARRVEEAGRKQRAQVDARNQSVSWAVGQIETQDPNDAGRAAALATGQAYAELRDGKIDADQFSARMTAIKDIEGARQTMEDQQLAEAQRDVDELVQANPGRSIQEIAREFPEPFQALNKLPGGAEVLDARVTQQGQGNARRNYARMRGIAESDPAEFARRYPQPDQLYNAMAGMTPQQQDELWRKWRTSHGGATQEDRLDNRLEMALAQSSIPGAMVRDPRTRKDVVNPEMLVAARTALREENVQTEEELRAWLMTNVYSNDFAYQDARTGQRLPGWAINVPGVQTDPFIQSAGAEVRFANVPENLAGAAAAELGFWDGRGPMPRLSDQQRQLVADYIAEEGVSTLAELQQVWADRQAGREADVTPTPEEARRTASLDARGFYEQHLSDDGVYVSPPDEIEQLEAMATATVRARTPAAPAVTWGAAGVARGRAQNMAQEVAKEFRRLRLDIQRLRAAENR